MNTIDKVETPKVEESDNTTTEIYKRLQFEVSVLKNELEKHVSNPVVYMSEMKNILQNSQKYFYIISRHLYPVNI